ncbi:hypothetical protein JIQ42_05727 [Leishmania sp. Namibia]|uniref:hypothetical protein n=1 Tax=Leishmania sp. Namibia TaxID=2802991 RepID=UPI001B57BB58|nr:hypothetical protein JIQ42_05727 [Leishmania sp. Namibia]
MLGKPASKSNSGDVGRGGYEFGEYDGVVDVEAILHTTAGASPNLAGSPAVADGDIGVYENHVSLQSDHRNGSASTPLGRGPPRKPVRMSAGPACSGDSQSTMPSSTAAASRYLVAVAGKSSDGAAASTAGRRTNSSYLSTEAEAHDAGALPTRQGTRKSTYSDDVVYLPAIGNQQQMRKKGSDAFPSRVRAPLPAPDPLNFAALTTINHSRTRASGSGAKSVTSTGNLESLQAPNDICGATSHNQHNGPATAGAPRPPYHAPPLSPLTTKGCHSTDDTNGPNAAGNTTNGSGVGDSLQEVSTRHRLAMDRAAKRGESVEVGKGSHMNGHCGGAATHNTTGSGSIVPASKTNGWVKEEARRLDQRVCTSCNTAATSRNEPQASGDPIDGFTSRKMVHQGASQFPQERMEDTLSKSSNSTQSPAADGSNTAMGHNSADGHACTKLNTSPAPVAPKAHVWAGDYEMANTPGVGSTTFSIVPMPKVYPSRPLAGGLKASMAVEGSSNNNRSCAKSPTRTSVQVLHPPPSEASAGPFVNGVALPTESAITPLRKVFTRPQKPAPSTNGAAADAVPNACPIPQVPLTNPPTSPTMATTATASRSSTAPQSTAASSPPAPWKTAMTPSHAVAAAKGDKSLSAPHTPALSHRSNMSAVGTSQRSQVHYSSAGQQVPLTSGSSRMSLLDQTRVSGVDLPYSEQRRAALEAWADVPVLTVTIRGQSLTPTQRAREMAKTSARPAAARQMYAPVNGQGRQEVAGEPCDLNYDVHNVVVQLRHCNRPLMMNYPPRLPLEVDMRPRMRRQRTLRSFYGNGMPHVGDAWFRDALNDARMVDSPDIEAMEKREEAEFIRNGGDPATRRNRYGQANNVHAHQQQHQRQPQHGNVGAAEV